MLRVTAITSIEWKPCFNITKGCVVCLGNENSKVKYPAAQEHVQGTSS